MRPTVAISLVLASALAFSASAQDLRGTTTGEAIELFDEVCGQTLPDFSEAKKRAESLGYLFNSADPRNDLSFEVSRTTSGQFIWCELSFGSSEQVPKILDSIQSFGYIGTNHADIGFRFGVIDPRVKYRDTEHSLRIYVGGHRIFGRYPVSLSIWVRQ